MKNNKIYGGGQFITFESSLHGIVFRSKTKDRALKIKNILDGRNKR